jgi:putative transposase
MKTTLNLRVDKDLKDFRSWDAKENRMSVSRHKKGSYRHAKRVDELAKQHEQIANQRRDFHCKTAHRLFSRYDAVAVEELEIRNLVKNHHLAKSISDAAWGDFILSCVSKAENAGKHLIKVPPHGTSQKCSGCGDKVKKSLAVRTPICNSCGLVMCRDQNAAINRIRAASALRGGVSVANDPKNLSIERKKREIPTVWKSETGQLYFTKPPSDSQNQWG